MKGSKVNDNTKQKNEYHASVVLNLSFVISKHHISYILRLNINVMGIICMIIPFKWLFVLSAPWDGYISIVNELPKSITHDHV